MKVILEMGREHVKLLVERVAADMARSRYWNATPRGKYALARKQRAEAKRRRRMQR